jgi:WD40 repeat protein
MFLYFSSIVFSFEPELKWKIQGGNSHTNAFVFSKDGKFIYVQYYVKSAGLDSFFIQKWNIEEKKVDKNIPCSLQFDKMVLSNDENNIAGINTNSPVMEIINFSNADSIKINNFPINSDMFSKSSFSFSEDGKSIYYYDYRIKYINVYDLTSYEVIDSKLFTFQTGNGEFSPDGKYACVAVGDSTISIFDMTANTELYKIKIPYSSYNICHLNINSEYFVVNYISTINPDNVEVYSMKTGKVVAKSKSSFKYPVSILLNDNKTILTSTSPYGVVEKYDFISNNMIKTNININGNQMICSSNGNWIAGKDSLAYLNIYELSSEKPILFLNQINENFIHSSKILISPDNKYVYASGIKDSDTLKRGQIIEYDFKTGVISKVYPVTENYLTDMIMSQDGTTLYVSDSTGRIEIISNLHNSGIKRKTYNLNKPIINKIAVSEDGSKLIAGGFMTGFFFINLKTDEIKSYYQDVYDLITFEPNIRSISFNKKGDKLIFAGNKKFILEYNFNSISGEFEKGNSFQVPITSYSADAGILYVTYSKDDKTIFCTSTDGYTRIINSDDFTETNKIQVVLDTNYSPISSVVSIDNKFIAVGDNFSGINIYKVNSDENLFTLQFDGIKFNKINSVYFSDNNEYIAYCTVDGKLGLFRIDNTSSVDENVDYSAINVYPNPASDYIEISLNKGLKPLVQYGVDIQIFDMLGVIVLSVEQTSPSIHKIDISNLAPGIYFIKIGNRVAKFVKM